MANKAKPGQKTASKTTAKAAPSKGKAVKQAPKK